MSKSERNGGLPSGFGMALALDPYATARFEAMTEEERCAVIDRARSITSSDEMRAYVGSLAGMKEPKGPVQL